MSTPIDKLRAAAEKLRRQIAKGEANVETLRAKLAKIEAKICGAPTPVTGLDLLWKTALPIARTRSSQVQCRAEWARIPLEDRPRVELMLLALATWNRCEEWRKDGNAYVPGLHRWIKARQWENVPVVEPRGSASRYRSTPKPAPVTDPADVPTKEEIKALLNLKR